MKIKEPTTLERLQHYKPEQFEQLGIQYISELIHNAADRITELEGDSLEDFYQWAKKIGHWRTCEQIERYRRMRDE